MKLELKPEILGVVKRQGDDATNAGMSRDGQISWTFREGFLEVTLSHTNEILASWRFGKHQKDTHTVITCVTDLHFCGGYLLVVATSNHTNEGVLNIFSVGLRRVIRAIEIPQRVTALDVVFTNVGEDVPGWILSKHLQFFSGLAAVGTEAGYIYLVDLCLDELLINHSTEAAPKKLSVIGPGIVDPKGKRGQAGLYDRNIAMVLDDQCHRQGHFYFRRQDDTIQKVLDEDSVTVTSIKYLSQAGTLAVGFNFGSFQLWRLYNPVLDYSSRYSPEGIAVSHFVVQEPENDPRNFVYLWVCCDDLSGDSVSNVCLYQLSFAKKDVYASFGTYYDELESVCARLDHKLTVDPYSSDTKTTRSSSIVNCYTIVNPYYTPPSKLSDSFEEGLYNNDLSLSVFVWCAESRRGGGATKHWMCIFDLNRWYHAQMPHSLRCHGSSLQVCSYWAVFSLDEVLSQTVSAFRLLNVEVSGDKVLRFINNSPLPPEEHSYPSALRLTSIQFIMSDSWIQARCDGWQGQLLCQFARSGAELLVQPADFYHRCHRARLLPQNYEELKTSTAEYQRTVLLNMALEHGLTSTLAPQCIQAWADGEFADQGCTLSFLLDWAWNRVASIKQSWDATCEMLYDWSGQHLDSRTDWLIESQTEVLSNLKYIFSALITQSSPTTESGQTEIEIRLDAITILLQHCEIVRWCVSSSLLPEIDEASDPLPGLFAYPISHLQEAYTKRRIELSSKKSTVKEFSLLLIDNLLDCQGSDVKKVWETLGGNGLYPPPSLQALVNMYLIEEISIEVKHAVTLYLLQDLAALAKAEVGDAVIASFIQRFMLSPGLVHQIQGLWFIDHRDFEEGVRHLVNPSIHSDLGGSWKHVAVVNTLLSQSEGKAATRYLHTKGVLGGSPQEQQLYISVLLHNRQVSQAVEYMRGCQSESNFLQLLAHLLTECQNYKLLGHLLQLNLTDAEEVYLEQYLRGHAEPHALEPLLLYYLHHSRFLQAFQLNEDMKRMDKLEMSHLAQERAATRNRLMDAYLKALPDVTRKLLMEKQRGTISKAKQVEVQRPKPLSTVVHNSDHVAMSRSHFVLAVLEKVTEAQDIVTSDSEDKEDLTANTITESKICHTSVVPFLSTPRTPKHKTYTRASEVIYPDLKLSPLVTNPLSTAKRKTLLDSAHGHLNGNISLRQLTQECLELLHTPIRNHRKRLESPHFGAADSHVKTPQSILKVQRLSKSLLSATKDKSRRSSGSHSTKLGFSASSSRQTTPSSSPPKTKPLAAAPLSVSTETTAVKQLRFVGISPSPASSPTMVFDSLPLDRPEEVLNKMEETSTTWKHVKTTEVLDSATDTLSREDIDTELFKTKDAHSVTVGENMSKNNSLKFPIRGVLGSQTDQSHVEGEYSSFVEGADYGSENEHEELVRPDLQSSWKHGQLYSHTEPTSPAVSPTSHVSSTDVVRDVENIMEAEDQCQRGDESVSSIRKHVFEESSEKFTAKYSQEVIKTSTRYLQISVVTDTPVTHSEEPPSPAAQAERNLSSLLTLSSHNLRSQKSSSVSPKSQVEKTVPKAAGQPDRRESPPATPPSSKKAKILELRSKELELTRRRTRSTPSPERSETDEPRRRKTPERKSPSRKLEHEEMQRKTPERRSPSRTLPKQEENVLRVTPERKLPARKIQRLEDKVVPSEDALDEPESHKNQRKTPERRSLGRNSRKQSISDDDDKQMKKESVDVAEASSSRRQRKHVMSEENEKKGKEVLGDISEAEAPETHVLRRSTRLNTPDRVLAEGSVSESSSPARRVRRAQKTPQKAAPETNEGEQKEEVEEKLLAGRRPTRRKELSEPEDDVSKVTPSSSKTADQSLNTTRSPGRQDKKKNDESDKEDEEAHNLRRTRRQSRTPDRFAANAGISEPLTPTRRSRRHKSPEKLDNTSEIEPVPVKVRALAPRGGHRERTASKDPAATVHQPEVQETSEAQTQKQRAESYGEQSASEVEQFVVPASPSRSTRKATRGKEAEPPSSPSRRGRSEALQETVNVSSARKTPDRQVKEDKTAKEAVPETDTSIPQSSSKVQKSHSQQPKSPGRSRRALTQQVKSPAHKTKRRDKESEGVQENNVDEIADGWGEEVPALRLEVEDENDVNSEDTDHQGESYSTATETKAVGGLGEISERSHQSHKKGPGSTASEDPLPPSSPARVAKTTKKSGHMEDMAEKSAPAFVFSPPVKHAEYSNEHVELSARADAEPVFVFSHPTVAADRDRSEDVLEVKPNSRAHAGGKLKSKRKRALFTDSPILLSPGRPVSHRILQKQYTESQRSAAGTKKNIPRARRIKPSTWTMPTTGQ